MEAFDSNSTNSSVPFNYQFTNNGIIYYTDSNGCWYTTNVLNPYSDGLLTGQFDVNTTSNVASDYACQPKEPTEAEMAALSNNSYLDLDGQSGQFEVDTSSNVAVDGAFLNMPLQQAPYNQITTSPTTIGKPKRTSYAGLITKAINSSPEKRMTLMEIYDWMEVNVVEFKYLSTASWKSSIRHCLLFHKHFKQRYDDTSKLSWWTLAEEVDSELVKLLRKPTTQPKVNAVTSAIIPPAQTMTSSVIFPPTETTTTMCAMNLNHSPQPVMTDQPLVSAQSIDQVPDQGQLFLQEGSQAAITLDRALEYEYADDNFAWNQDGVGGFAVKESETEAAALMNYSHPNPHGLTGQFEVDTSSNMAVDGAFLNMSPLQQTPDNQITASPTTNFYHKPTGHGKHPTYAELITKAINSSPEKRLTLSEIYDWMVANVVEFMDQPCSSSNGGWKNSIRHNLSLHKRFKRVKQNGSEKSWWTITDQVDGDRIKVQTRSTTRPQGKTVTSAIRPRATTTTTTTCAMNLNHSPQPMVNDQQLISAQSMDQVLDQGQMTGQLLLQEGSQAAIALGRALEYANSLGAKPVIAIVATIGDD